MDQQQDLFDPNGTPAPNSTETVQVTRTVYVYDSVSDLLRDVGQYAQKNGCAVACADILNLEMADKSVQPVIGFAAFNAGNYVQWVIPPKALKATWDDLPSARQCLGTAAGRKMLAQQLSYKSEPQS